jgi:hypothetical protein
LTEGESSKTRVFWLESEPERRVHDTRGAECPRRSYGSGEGAYLRRRLRRFGAAAGAAAAFLRRLRRFGAAAAFFAFFRAAMIHPLVDESVRRGRSRARTLSPFVRAVKGMFRGNRVARRGPSPNETRIVPFGFLLGGAA